MSGIMLNMLGGSFGGGGGDGYWAGSGSNWDGSGTSIYTSANAGGSQINVATNLGITIDDGIGGFKFSPDGTKLVIVGYNNTKWTIVNLNSAFDVTGGKSGYTQKTWTTAQLGFDCHISEDGTRLYHAGYSEYNQYTLSTPWDMSSIGSADNTVTQSGIGGIHVSSNGQYLVTNSQSSNYLVVYEMTTPWDVSTATNAQSIANGGDTPRSMVVSADGKTFVWQFTGGTGTSEGIKYFQCSTAWDLSTAGSTTSINVTTDGTGMGFDIASDGSGIFYGSYNYVGFWKFT